MGGGIVRPQDGFIVERRPVTGCERTARETGEDAAAFLHPLGAMSSWGERLTRRQRRNDNYDGVHGTPDFVRGHVDKFDTQGCQSCQSIVWVGLWRQELQGREKVESAHQSVS